MINRAKPLATLTVSALVNSVDIATRPLVRLLDLRPSTAVRALRRLKLNLNQLLVFLASLLWLVVANDCSLATVIANHAQLPRELKIILHV